MIKLRPFAYILGASVGAFIARLMTPAGYIRPHRRWQVYYLREDDPSDFTLRQFKAVVAPECYGILTENDSMQSMSSDQSLFYIGHGDPNGVYSCGGFRAGIKHYLCSAPYLSSADWSIKPSVWWACHSARWLTDSQRADWLGFRDIIGYDLSTAAEKRWWEVTLQKIIRAVILVADGVESPTRLSGLLTGLVSEAALSQHTMAERRTWMSQLFVVALEDAIRHGQTFGGSNDASSAA